VGININVTKTGSHSSFKDDTKSIGSSLVLEQILATKQIIPKLRKWRLK
jgi:hypothetical protein